MIRRYSVVYRDRGRPFELDLCGYHANVRRFFGHAICDAKTSAAADAKCDDCFPVAGPTVLDRVVAEAEDRERSEEPKPVEVLPGQMRLFE